MIKQFTVLFSIQILGPQTKRFRILTGWLVGSQVFEMDAFDDLHRQTTCCGIVNQAHEDLWRGSLTNGLE